MLAETSYSHDQSGFHHEGNGFHNHHERTNYHHETSKGFPRESHGLHHEGHSYQHEGHTLHHDNSSYQQEETGFHQEGASFQHEGTRKRRLADVKRGAEYYKKLDTIAEAQWRSNVPKLPEVTRKLSSLPKITTSVLSDTGTGSSYPRGSLLNMTSTPRQSMSVVSATESTLTGFTPASHSQLSLPHNLSRIIHHRTSPNSSPLYSINETHEERDNKNFNQWGTSHSRLDDKIALTPDDLKPRELPFQFRDSRKLVVKPVPRKSVPMSRVAANERDRHQRTVTNFRSRNGTIRIIRPLEPLPEIEKFQKAGKQEVFDVENIEREKTFLMLERIDRILHPNKRSPRTNLGSSEEEIPGTSDSSAATITEAQVGTDELHRSLSTQNSPRKSSQSPQLSYRPKVDKSRLGVPPAQRPRRQHGDNPFKSRTPKTFAEMLHSLEISEEDAHTKCQAWVNQCGQFDPLSLSYPEASG